MSSLQCKLTINEIRSSSTEVKKTLSFVAFVSEPPAQREKNRMTPVQGNWCYQRIKINHFFLHLFTCATPWLYFPFPRKFSVGLFVKVNLFRLLCYLRNERLQETGGGILLPKKRVPSQPVSYHSQWTRFRVVT